MKKFNVWAAVVLLFAILMTASFSKIDDTNDSATTWVDLGLPSGLLWASHNVGANSPEGYGNYYAWGETSPKSVYDWSTYRYARYDNDRGHWVVTKYTGRDGLTTLQPSDDAATVNMGGGARTPTKEEWHELGNNTTHHWTTYNGMSGLCCTGRNGNSIFLPAAGYILDSFGHNGGGHGYYWSGSLDTVSPHNAWSFNFNDDYWNVFSYYRGSGFTVRAVRGSGQK